MSDIRAIETRYKGYRFRSRLEARWAVFFDSCGFGWKYEDEGFMLPNGENYLPDFWLESLGLFAEIKGKSFTDSETERCRILCQASGRNVMMLDGLPSIRPYPTWITPSHLEDRWLTEDARTLSDAIAAALSSRFEHGESGSAIERRRLSPALAAQRSLVWSFIHRPGSLEEIAEMLGAESFSDPVCRRIYEAYLEHFGDEADKHLDPEALALVTELRAMRRAPR